MFFVITLVLEVVAVVAVARRCDRLARNETLHIVGATAAVIFLVGLSLWLIAGQRPDFHLLPFVILAVANAAMAGCTRPIRQSA